MSRAIVKGRIATIKDGKRIVNKYYSGEKLIGEILQNDSPPFTGYVRNFGRKKK